MIANNRLFVKYILSARFFFFTFFLFSLPLLSQKNQKNNFYDDIQLVGDEAESLDDADFFFSDRTIPLETFLDRGISAHSAEEELASVIGKFNRLGKDYEVFYYRADSPFLKNLGFESVRVIIPQLLTFYIREENAPLGSRRFRDAPRALGFSPAATINPIPHPFL